MDPLVDFYEAMHQLLKWDKCMLVTNPLLTSILLGASEASGAALQIKAIRM